MSSTHTPCPSGVHLDRGHGFLRPMSGLAILVVVFLALLAAANAKTSRPTGMVRGLHPYRRVMGFVMPTERIQYISIVTSTPSSSLPTWPRPARDFGCDVTTAWRLPGITMVQNPTVNRFSLGGSSHQRDGVYLSFSMKRAQADRAAKLRDQNPAQEGQRPSASSASESTADSGRGSAPGSGLCGQEFGLMSRIPRPILWLGVRALKTLDYYNLLPGASSKTIRSTPVCSAQSRQPADGRRVPPPLRVGHVLGVHDGRPNRGSSGRSLTASCRSANLHLRFTYDERMDDGLNARFGIETFVYGLEHPFSISGVSPTTAVTPFP
jgi:hypothetical protein